MRFGRGPFKLLLDKNLVKKKISENWYQWNSQHLLEEESIELLIDSQVGTYNSRITGRLPRFDGTDPLREFLSSRL